MAGAERNVSIIIKAKNEADKALTSLGKNLTSIPVMAAAATAALAAVGYALTRATMAAAEQEKADVRLATALASIGQNSAAVREHLARFISTLQDVTTVGDETISGVVATFAQLGQLSGEALEQATQAALDYAAATGQDVQTAATQMVNVLVKGSGRLQGIATDFDSASSKGERFASVILQINDKMGGAAEVAGKTFSGALQRIANDYDDLTQEIGRTVVENEAFRGLLESLSLILKEATAFVVEHGEAFGDLVTMMSRAAVGLLEIGADIASFQFHFMSATAALGMDIVRMITLLDGMPALAKKAFGWTDRDSIDLAKWAGKWMQALGAIGGAFGDAGDSAETVSERIEDIISGLGKGTGKTIVAETISNIGNSAGAAKEEMDAFAQVINDLGIPALEELETTALNVDEALQMLVALNEVGALSPEEWDTVLGAITEITRQLPQWGDDLSAAQGGARGTLLVLTEMEEALQHGLTGAVDGFGSALIDAAAGARIAWGQFFRQLLADLLKAIFRATVIQGIFKALGIALGGPAGGAAGGWFGSAAASGGFSGLSSLADAAAMVAPVQTVLPGSSAAMGAGPAGAAAWLGGGASSEMGALNMPITILPRRDRTAEAIEMLEEIRTLVERRGYYLPATAVIG